jgi:nucleoside-diphosphate-sugar epimerase
MGIFKFIQAALNKNPVEVYGDGEQTRDFTFIEDAVSATLAAVNHGRHLEAYNVSGGQLKTVNEVLQEIESLTGFSITKNFVKGPKGDQFRTFASTVKAQVELNWKPKALFRQSLSQQIDWQKLQISN